MVDVVLVDAFDTKVIDNEGKADGAPCVCPISRGDLALTVPGDEEAFLEEFLCENAGLGKAVHAALDFAKMLPSESVMSLRLYSSMMSSGNRSSFILKYSYLDIGVMR